MKDAKKDADRMKEQAQTILLLLERLNKSQDALGVATSVTVLCMCLATILSEHCTEKEIEEAGERVKKSVTNFLSALLKNET